MFCTTVREEALRLLEEALAPELRVRIERHLDRCEACRRYTDELEATTKVLAKAARAHRRAVEADGPTDALTARLFEAAGPLLADLASGERPALGDDAPEVARPERTPATRSGGVRRHRPLGRPSSPAVWPWLLAASAAALLLAAISLRMGSGGPSADSVADTGGESTPSTRPIDLATDPRRDPTTPDDAGSGTGIDPTANDDDAPERPDPAAGGGDDDDDDASDAGGGTAVDPGPGPGPGDAGGGAATGPGDDDDDDAGAGAERTPPSPDPDPDPAPATVPGRAILVVAGGAFDVEDAASTERRDLPRVERLAPGSLVVCRDEVALLDVGGRVRIAFAKEATARIDLTDSGAIVLRDVDGDLWLDHAGGGLELELPGARVTAIGTRFGVSVERRRSRSARALVHVDDGAVRVDGDEGKPLVLAEGYETRVIEEKAPTAPKRAPATRARWAAEVAGLLFSDAFEDGIHDPRWQAHGGGTFEATGRRLELTAAPEKPGADARFEIARIGGTRVDGRDDLVLRASIESQQWAGVGIAARVRDLGAGVLPPDENHGDARGALMVRGVRRYLARIEAPNRIALIREGGARRRRKADPLPGSVETIGEAKISRLRRGAKVDLALAVRGAKIEVWLGKRKIIEVADDAILTGGVGLVAQNAGDRFDDVRVERLEVDVPPERRLDPASMPHPPTVNGKVDGKAFAVDPKDGGRAGDYVVYGPYADDLTPGAWVAVFTLTVPADEVTDDALATPVCIVDATDSRDDQDVVQLSLRQVTLERFAAAARIAEGAPPRPWIAGEAPVRHATIEVEVPFVFEAGQKVELRVRWDARVKLRVEEIRLFSTR